MNRRDFLRSLLPAGITLAAGPTLLTRIFEWLWPTPPPLTEEELKAKIIAKYLKSPEGREKLAASMAQPLRTRLDYDSMGRKMFQVQPLPNPRVEAAQALHQGIGQALIDGGAVT